MYVRLPIPKMATDSPSVTTMTVDENEKGYGGASLGTTVANDIMEQLGRRDAVKPSSFDAVGYLRTGSRTRFDDHFRSRPTVIRRDVSPGVITRRIAYDASPKFDNRSEEWDTRSADTRVIVRQRGGRPSI